MGAQDDGQVRCGGAGGEDLLPGAAPFVREEGAQGLVPVGDVGQGAAQRRAVERAAQPQPDGDAVLRAVIAVAAEEPQPLLGVGQRDHSSSPSWDSKESRSAWLMSASDTSDGVSAAAPGRARVPGERAQHGEPLLGEGADPGSRIGVARPRSTWR